MLCIFATGVNNTTLICYRKQLTNRITKGPEEKEMSIPDIKTL